MPIMNLVCYLFFVLLLNYFVEYLIIVTSMTTCNVQQVHTARIYDKMSQHPMFEFLFNVILFSSKLGSHNHFATRHGPWGFTTLCWRAVFVLLLNFTFKWLWDFRLGERSPSLFLCFLTYLIYISISLHVTPTKLRQKKKFCFHNCWILKI